MDTVHYDRNDRSPRDIAEYLLGRNYTVCIWGNRNNRAHTGRSAARRTQNDTDTVPINCIEILSIPANRRKACNLHLVPGRKSRACSGRNARPRSDVGRHTGLSLDHICVPLSYTARKLKFLSLLLFLLCR